MGTEELVERHHDLWLSDGNIVLSTRRKHGDLQQLTLFRVHKSVLARHSNVFHDMLSETVSAASEGKGVNDLYDGLSAVSLSDTTEDLEAILKVLYDPWRLSYKPYEPAPVSAAEPLIHMARKYQMDTIQQRVIENIERDWPRSLKEWDMLETRLEMLRADETRPDRMCAYAAEPASTVVLARKYDIPSVLPAAFYDLCRLPVVNDLGEQPGRESYNVWDERAASWASLSGADYHCVVRGRDRLRKFLSVNFISNRRFLSRDCRADDCSSRASAICAKVTTGMIQVCDPLAALRTCVQSLEEGREARICYDCCETMKANFKDLRQRIWNSIPMTFDIPDSLLKVHDY